MSVLVSGMLSVPSATVMAWFTRTLRFHRVLSSSLPTKSSDRPLKQQSWRRCGDLTSMVWVVLAPRASVTVSVAVYLPGVV